MNLLAGSRSINNTHPSVIKASVWKLGEKDRLLQLGSLQNKVWKALLSSVTQVVRRLRNQGWRRVEMPSAGTDWAAGTVDPGSAQHWLSSSHNTHAGKPCLVLSEAVGFQGVPYIFHTIRHTSVPYFSDYKMYLTIRSTQFLEQWNKKNSKNSSQTIRSTLTLPPLLKGKKLCLMVRKIR